MINIRISQAEGLLLDLAVALALGFKASISASGHALILRDNVVDYYDPSQNWGWAGVILDQEQILEGPSPFDTGGFAAGIGNSWGHATNVCSGPTRLVAVMRCFVTFKIGREINIRLVSSALSQPKSDALYPQGEYELA